MHLFLFVAVDIGQRGWVRRHDRPPGREGVEEAPLHQGFLPHVHQALRKHALRRRQGGQKEKSFETFETK